jgi:flagellar basal body rod protein FlgF
MVGALVDMIEQSRAFEMHIKMIGTAEEIDQTAMSMFRLG